jgi:hypothetical protein
VQEYLAELAGEKTPANKLPEILFQERDVFVRQLLRHRFNGRSANEPAFKYAIGCHARNRETGAASMIKAMLVADRTPTEIAEELGTTAVNVATFAKVFFDARPFLGNEAFLRRVCLGGANTDMGQAEALRERRWLAAAFHRGWPGVEQVMLHRGPSAPADIDALTRQLQAKLASRALEYVEGLEADDVAPSEDDLRRFNASRNLRAPEASTTAGGSSDMAQDFMRGLQTILLEKAATSDDPKLVAMREIHGAIKSAPPEPHYGAGSGFSTTN